MKSTSSACKTSASAKWPIRTLAITGIVTVFMISRITLIDAMRATPPSLRMSDGTRSSAITAQAPAFSAILACSAFVTSIITPPFSISARPTLTRHSFEPLLPLPLPFGFFTSILLLPSLFKLSDGVSPSNLLLWPEHHEPPFTASQHISILVSNLAAHEKVSSIHLRLAPFHHDLFVHGDGLQVFHTQLRRHRANFPETANFSHGFIQQQRDDSAMSKPRAALVSLTQHEPPHDLAILVVLLERQLHPAGVVPAAAKTFIRGIRLQPDRVAQSSPRSLSPCFHTSFFFTSYQRHAAPLCHLRISTFSISAKVATPRATCFSSRLENASRSVFGSGLCT